MQNRVTLQTGGEVYKALVLVNQPVGAAPLIQRLTEAGFIADTSSDPVLSLERCRRNPPDLAVVEENLSAMSGIRFITNLLKVSWDITTILISERDGESIHKAAEGLGILGHIKECKDLEGLERLLKKFEEIVPPARDTVS